MNGRSVNNRDFHVLFLRIIVLVFIAPPLFFVGSPKAAWLWIRAVLGDDIPDKEPKLSLFSEFLLFRIPGAVLVGMFGDFESAGLILRYGRGYGESPSLAEEAEQYLKSLSEPLFNEEEGWQQRRL